MVNGNLEDLKEQVEKLFDKDVATDENFNKYQTIYMRFVVALNDEYRKNHTSLQAISLNKKV